MSGIDVAAGVAGLATVGLAVAREFFQIAYGIGSAGNEVRMCAWETKIFSRMLEDLSDALKMPTAATRATQSTTEDLIDICRRILDPFEYWIMQLKPLLEKYRNSNHQLRQLSLRIQWYFRYKSKISFYQQALGQLKATLTCLLASMNYQEAKVSAPQMIFIYYIEVETSKKSIKGQRENRTVLIQPPSEVRRDSRLLLRDTDSDEQTEAQDAEVEDPIQDSDDQVVNHGGLSAKDISSIESDIDKDPSPETAIAVYDDLLSLQRRVLRIAENVLKSSNVLRPAKVLQEPSSIPSLAPDSLSEGWSAAESSSQHTKPVSEVNSQTPAHGIDNSVILKGPSDTKYALPYSECRTWDCMRDTIKGIFGNDPTLKDNIASGFYALYRDNDTMISFNHWESLIAPGMCLTLRIISVPFDNLSINAPTAGISSAKADSLSLLRADGSPYSTNKDSHEGDSQVQLTDSKGITYGVPFKACKTRKDFDDLLLMIYERRTDDDKNYYQDSNNSLRPYSAYRDDNIRIPLHLWEVLIRPGWRIRVVFDDARLNSGNRSLLKENQLSMKMKQRFRGLF